MTANPDAITAVSERESITGPRKSCSKTEIGHGPQIPDQATLETLARQRPEIFTHWAIELGFVGAVVGSMMISEYTISGFNIAMPVMVVKLGIPEAERTWPSAVPNLTTAAFLLPFARLSDRYGSRLIFLCGHIWLTIWSLICGFSQNTTMLIVCRAMQGIGSSAFLPASLSLLGQTYRPGPRKNMVFGLFGAFGCIGFYYGIFIGALAAQVLGWKWYFWIGSVSSLVVALIGYMTFPKTLGVSDSSVKMDWLGVFTIVPGLALVVFALTDSGAAPHGWRTPYIYITLVIGCLFLCAAVYVQGWCSQDPLFPPDLFRPKYMKRLVASLFMSYGVFGLFLFYASFYIENVIVASPLQAAAWFAPLAGGGLVLALTGGFVLHLIPGRILMIISGLGFVGSPLLFAMIPSTGSTSYLYWAFVFPSMICGTIGIDIAFNVTNVFITTSLPRRLQAVAGALINSLLYLGIAVWLGVADVVTTVTINAKGSKHVSQDQQYKIGFWTAVGLAAASFCIIITVKMDEAAADMTADEKLELDEMESGIQLSEMSGEKE